MTWVKICGTTNVEDARAAVEAGADGVGFVFGPSPRRIEPERGAEIASALPQQIEKVGVFVNEAVQRIREVAAKVGLTAVQLQGDEPLEVLKSIMADASFRVIPALSIARMPEDSAGGFLLNVPQGIETVLIDSVGKDRRGGTGKAWDWNAGAHVVAALRNHVKFIVAGGLTPTNVAEAIATLHPWGVDVCSGVEREQGKKDHEKVRAFVAAVRAADRL